MNAALLLAVLALVALVIGARRPGASPRHKATTLAVACLLMLLLVLHNLKRQQNPDEELRGWEPLYSACQYEVLAKVMIDDQIKEVILIDTEPHVSLSADTTGREKSCSRSRFVGEILARHGIHSKILPPNFDGDTLGRGEDLETVLSSAPRAVLFCGGVSPSIPAALCDIPVYGCDTNADVMLPLVQAGVLKAWTGYRQSPSFNARQAPPNAQAAFDLRYQLVRPALGSNQPEAAADEK